MRLNSRIAEEMAKDPSFRRFIYKLYGGVFVVLSLIIGLVHFFS